jgi:hypothetical protein
MLGVALSLVFVMILITLVMHFFAALDIGRLSLALRCGWQFEDAQHVRQLRLRLFDCGLLLVRRSDMLEADNVHAGNDEFHFDFLAFDGDVERTLAVNMRAKLTMLRFFGEGRGSKNEGRGNEASKYLQHFFSPSEITVAALSSLAGAANNRAGKGEEARDD